MEEVFEQQRVLYGQPPVYIRQLYILVMLLLTAVLSSMLFITVDVVAVCPAITRQNGEMIPIHSRRSGIIDSVFVGNGDSIKAGGKIAKLDNIVVSNKLVTLRKEQEALEVQIGRLEMLGHYASQFLSAPVSLKAEKTGRQYQLFMANMSAWRVKLDKAGSDLELSKVLRAENIIAPADLAIAENKFREINTSFRAFISEQLVSWETERFRLSERLSRLKMDVFETEKESESHYIYSPIRGVASGLAGRIQSDIITTTEVFCFVSPCDSLVIETYVTPAVRAFLAVGQPVFYSFNLTGADYLNIYSGKISVIAPVMDWYNGQPVYRVLSSMSSNNGNSMESLLPVAGVSLRSRFHITKRKLWQLLISRFRHFTQPVSVIK